jgi:hypothetical protein
MHRALHFISKSQPVSLEEVPKLWRVTTACFLVQRPKLLEDGAWFLATLRGAWGHQLKQLSQEAYEVFFVTLAHSAEGRGLPKPFTLSVENHTDNLTITLSLFGIADSWRDPAFEAFIAALKQGISLRSTGFPQRKPLHLHEWHFTRSETVIVPKLTGNNRLLFKTPVRFGSKDVLKDAEIAIIPALLSRVLSLAAWNGLQITIDPHWWQSLDQRLVLNTNALYPISWWRFSGAQNRRAIPMMGLLGSLDIIRTPDTLMPLLALAQTAFIGQHTALGLGRFELL